MALTTPIPLTDEEKEARDKAMESGRYAFTPVITKDGFTLGVACEGISGYLPTDYHSVPTYKEADKWADAINNKRLSKKEALMIVASTMRSLR